MKKLNIILLVSVLLVLPFVASAASTAETVVCRILNTAKNIIVMIGFFIAVVFLIIGAIKYLTSQGDDEKATTARKMIVNALIGIAILVGIYIIISFVQTTVTEVGIGGTFLQNPCAGLTQ